MGDKNFVKRTLVSFDTDRIKGYVFGTDKLKEIRGASAILDGLNRVEMVELAKKMKLGYQLIYANGGSGMFLVDADEKIAEEFAQSVRREYSKQTHRGSSITYVVQKLPDTAPQDITKLMDHNLEETLEWLRYKMRKEKDCPSDFTMLSSHPFMRPCDACGVNYAEPGRTEDEDEEDEGEQADATDYYCASCRAKRGENKRIRENINWAIKNYTRGSTKLSKTEIMEEPLWKRIIYHLKEDDYKFTAQRPRRPKDFNVFRQFSKSKEYIGLIYADGNNMGSSIEGLNSLNAIKGFSLNVDSAIHQALSSAIKQHLPIEAGNPPLFPFDVLLLGGDDLMIVTDAAKAMDVALTIAKKFREFSYKAGEKPLSLSVGIILAPVKYPFSLLQELAEQTLKAAKKGSTKARKDAKKRNEQNIDDTRISFLVIAGSSVHSYKHSLEGLEKGKDIEETGEEFHATLRPYAPDTLASLLTAIDDAHKSSFNRSKLHQMREAILKMNLTSSVSESMATIRNWQPKQREAVVSSLYKIGMQKQFERQIEVGEPIPFSDFPRVTMPWFYDGKNEYHRDIYRTSILDFIELYDFVHREASNGKTTH